LHNGEIYNSDALRSGLKDKYTFKSTSDSETIGAMYKEHGPEALWSHLDGMFGVIVYDDTTKRFLVGRDHTGIIPLYWGVGK
jgi:asparagine synthase (glutamine-hydrolysing)